MPVFIAKFESCDCIPVPDFIFRADNMVSAVMKCQETLENIQRLVAGSKVDVHSEPTISGIEEADGLELMDEEGIEDLVSFWKAVGEAK